MIPARSIAFWIGLTATSAAAGLLFAATLERTPYAIGAVFGAVIGITVMAFERGLIAPSLHRRIRMASTPVYVASSLLINVALILLGSTLAGAGLWAVGVLDETLLQAVTPPRYSIVYSLIVSSLVAFGLRIRDLIGAQLFGALLLGRYHRPVSEKRVFLFVDLVGSTSFAARHGDLRAQEYLGEFFALLAAPVRRFRGTIDDYVGDMALVSWPLERGIRDGACLECVLAIGDAVTGRTDAFRARFGEAPSFRAALHAGTVVTAEIGLDRHKIAYFGDAVNTTARLEGLSKEVGASIIVSGELMGLLPRLPERVKAVDLGPRLLRGRHQPLPCFSLERRTALATAA